MRRVVAAFLALFGLLKTTAALAQENEASTSYDTIDVEPFLEHLDARLHLNLDVAAIAKFTRETELEDERATLITVRFSGRDYTVKLHVFTDDIGDSAICFLTNSKFLADAILAEMGVFAEERGM